MIFPIFNLHNWIFQHYTFGADNVIANAGAGGATFATDDVAGVHYPIGKLAHGALDSATVVSTSSGLPVQQQGTWTVQPGNTANTTAWLVTQENIHTADFDTGAGTDTTPAIGIAVAASGGAAVITGDTTNGLDVDVTRVGGSVTVAQATASNLNATVVGTGTLAVQVDNTVTVGSHAVTNAGTFAVQVDGSALTALQKIDDPVIVDDAAFTPATSSVMMAGAEFDDTAPDSVDEGDAGALRMSANRNLYTTIRDAAGNERGVNVNASNQLAVSVDNTVTVASHAVTNAGTFAVQVDGSALTALQLIDNTVLVDDAAFTPATSSVNMAGFEADETATDSVDEGDAGAARMTLDRKVIVTPQPHTAGGLSIFRSLDLDETEEDVKTSAGQVYSCWVTNTATTTRWLKFYNDTAANVVVGTTTPQITIGIPGNTSDDIAGHFAGGGYGIAFGTAICVAATTGVADNDTGAPAANDVIVNIFFK